MSTIINASTSSGLIQTADTSGTLELQSNGTTQLTVSSTGAYGQLKSATAQASTSGTSIDFTSIPSWVKRITVMFAGVSSNSTSNYQIQLGTSGGVETSGYAGAMSVGGGGATVWDSAGFLFATNQYAASTYNGIVTITNLTSNTWCESGIIGMNVTGQSTYSGGSKTLAGTLDRVRITTVNGTDTFDAGSINILYEG